LIPLKNDKEIAIMAEGGKKLAAIMHKLTESVQPGVTALELDKVAENLVFRSGAKPAFKGYRDPGGEPRDAFPATLCVSVNEEVVHGVPTNRQLIEGDIVTLDLGILYNGFYTDMAQTVPVGKKVDHDAARLIHVAKKALKRGIKKAKPGSTTGDIGNTIERYVQGQGCEVIRELSGHGIGRGLHEEPQIPNYGKRRSGTKLVEDMVICIEPMITMGDWRLKRAADGHTYVTKDGSLSAHFEHTVAITKKGPEVLTEMD